RLAPDQRSNSGPVDIPLDPVRDDARVPRGRRARDRAARRRREAERPHRRGAVGRRLEREALSRARPTGGLELGGQAEQHGAAGAQPVRARRRLGARRPRAHRGPREGGEDTRRDGEGDERLEERRAAAPHRSGPSTTGRPPAGGTTTLARRPEASARSMRAGKASPSGSRSSAAMPRVAAGVPPAVTAARRTPAGSTAPPPSGET